MKPLMEQAEILTHAEFAGLFIERITQFVQSVPLISACWPRQSAFAATLLPERLHESQSQMPFRQRIRRFRRNSLYLLQTYLSR